MVGYSSPKEYLKHLKIQRNYTNKFLINYAYHNDLTNICKQFIYCLDIEINNVENFIAKNTLRSKNISIYDFSED